LVLPRCAKATKYNGTDEALMDWVLVDKRLKGRLEDVNVLRSSGGVIGSDHFLLVARMCWGERGMKSERKKK
jgi:hypothetical protein